ncbi:MAG: hypothetical protein HY366_02600 [Candidatus Aenigmarchaeota archaeon]|nr:hypothetical protein [Candidatus Aenigmarchaeota archaeon]
MARDFDTRIVFPQTKMVAYFRESTYSYRKEHDLQEASEYLDERIRKLNMTKFNEFGLSFVDSWEPPYAIPSEIIELKIKRPYRATVFQRILVPEPRSVLSFTLGDSQLEPYADYKFPERTNVLDLEVLAIVGEEFKQASERAKKTKTMDFTAPKPRAIKGVELEGIFMDGSLKITKDKGEERVIRWMRSGRMEESLRAYKAHSGILPSNDFQ